MPRHGPKGNPHGNKGLGSRVSAGARRGGVKGRGRLLGKTVSRAARKHGKPK